MLFLKKRWWTQLPCSKEWDWQEFVACPNSKIIFKTEHLRIKIRVTEEDFLWGFLLWHAHWDSGTKPISETLHIKCYVWCVMLYKNKLELIGFHSWNINFFSITKKKKKSLPKYCDVIIVLYLIIDETNIMEFTFENSWLFSSLFLSSEPI